MPSANPPKKAETLDRFWESLLHEPLHDKKELDAFYCQEVNAVRGEDRLPDLKQKLYRAHGGRHFRAFLAGHSGCGKSTELARFSLAVADRFRVIRFSAKDELHPSSAKPFDVLILMMIRMTEEIRKLQSGGLKWEPPNDLLQKTLDWFAGETVKKTETNEVKGSAEASAGISGDSLWSKLLGLSAKLKGEIKYSSERKKEVIDYRVARLSELSDLVNQFLDACNEQLRGLEGQREWLFLGEDFEKFLDSEIPRTFFVREAALFKTLRTHLIFTIPVDLAWHAQGTSLPFPVFPIYDIPVYTKNNEPHKEGRAALRELLGKRINLNLFEAPHQLDRLIVASGGHLRDLLDLVNDATDRVLIETPPGAKIGKRHCTKAITKKQQEVLLRLGESPYETGIEWKDRAACLVAIYKHDSDHEVANKVTHSLLRSRAVQHFNGEGRFAVAPMVVSILMRQGEIKPADSPGGLLPE